MYQLIPILFMLAMIPESQKKMENINSFIMATKDSVESIRFGMETFRATMMPFMMAQAGKQQDKTGPSSSSSGGGSFS